MNLMSSSVLKTNHALKCTIIITFWQFCSLSIRSNPYKDVQALTTIILPLPWNPYKFINRVKHIEPLNIYPLLNSIIVVHQRSNKK